ncbi:30s ribosomal protein s17p-like protein [Fusarium flagelliforme]|uniref:30s ribosomal protein s17p-like protein n=1 Tax=Fusarium flagelliforme TaxID=2675880 RepID=A0A395N591_9HYPO|nr:30s ribosomal protein s17p-like protein [Fusarium flagelliforme]
MDRYYGKGVKWDLDEVIDCTRQALSAVGNDDQPRASLLDRLGISLVHYHWRGGIRSDPALKGYLEEAIAVSRQAVELTPKDHPALAGRLKNMGTLLEHKYHSTKTKDQEELRECIKYHVAAVHAEQSPTLRRIRAADDVLSYCADVPDWDLAYEVSTIAVTLFPKLIFRSHQHSDKLHMLAQVSGLASEAAAVALNAGKDLGAVLTILEEGRSSLSVYGRDESRPRELASSASTYTDALDDPDETWQAESRRQKEAVEKLDELLSKIRKEPGFEDYLLPPSEADMKAAAEKGPIVLINMSRFRCDAIVIDTDCLRLLPLPKLTLPDIEGAYQMQQIEPSTPFQKVDYVSNSNFDVWDAVVSSNEWDVLGRLWETIAEPVLNLMGYKGVPEDGIWPHAWWIPTGSLSRFAIHVAGDHYPGTHETVLDRTVFSYNSSVKSIIQGRRREAALRESQYVLLVAMGSTRGYRADLPFAPKEIFMVSDVCRSMSLNPLQPDQKKQDIIPYLRDCTIFHFAGHGQSDNQNPLNSKLLLNDWDSDPFTVTSLFNTKLQYKSEQVFYLVFFFSFVLPLSLCRSMNSSVSEQDMFSKAIVTF